MASSRCIAALVIFVLIVASVFIITGIVGLVIGPDILQNQIVNQLPLTAYSDQLASWEIPPVPIYLQFWLWECVNVLEVLQGGKPMLRQVGPFTYAEHRTKRGVYFNENFTVTYRQPISYSFIREKSVDDEQRMVKMINPTVVTMVSALRNQKPFVQELFNIVTDLFDETLFVSHTVAEWLWGYEDPILKAAKELPVLGELIPDDHFGYFYGQNATDDGLYTVFTGGSNIELLNNINKWNGVSYLNYWKTSWANQINGTDGSWFPPLYKKDLDSVRLYLYSTDVCRSLYAKFDKHSSVLGIPTEIFAIPSELFLNSSAYPDNAPFGLNVSGVFNVSICRQGAPIFISFPHFLYADNSITGAVDGLSANEEAHRVLFEVEPHTGLVLSAQKRLQINVQIQSEQYVDDFKHISKAIIPAIWINESTTIDQSSADDLYNQVLKYFTVVRWLSIGLISSGGIIFLVIIILFIRRRKSLHDSSTPLLYARSHNSILQQDDYH